MGKVTIGMQRAAVPLRVDPEQPSGTRVHNVFLGGPHNFAADRSAAAAVLQAMPQLAQVMRVNRSFMRRAVTAVAIQGVRQFLDLGSGIPTEDNVHDVARRVHLDSRTVYVDLDPVAVAHTRTLLADDPSTGVIRADLTDPDAVLADPTVRRLIDVDEPVCLLVVAVAQHIADTECLRRCLCAYLDAVPAGSHLIMSHLSGEGDPHAVERAQQAYNKAIAPLVARNRGEVAQLLHGWDLISPGLTHSGQWQPDPDDPEDNETASRCVLTAVGRKS